MTTNEKTRPKPSAKARADTAASRLTKGLLLALRFLLVPALCLAGLAVGLVIGYVYIGEQPMEDVWNLETWKHIFDLVFADS